MGFPDSWEGLLDTAKATDDSGSPCSSELADPLEHESKSKAIAVILDTIFFMTLNLYGYT